MKGDSTVAETERKTRSDKKTLNEKRVVKQPNAVSRYLREMRGELRKVTWPSRDESRRLTAIVLGVTLAMAIFLWVFDSIFSNVIEFLIQQIVGL
jgi:preprotein translocase subunit SecE